VILTISGPFCSDLLLKLCSCLGGRSYNFVKIVFFGIPGCRNCGRPRTLGFCAFTIGLKGLCYCWVWFKRSYINLKDHNYFPRAFALTKMVKENFKRHVNANLLKRLWINCQMFKYFNHPSQDPHPEYKYHYYYYLYFPDGTSTKNINSIPKIVPIKISIKYSTKY